MLRDIVTFLHANHRVQFPLQIKTLIEAFSSSTGLGTVVFMHISINIADPLIIRQSGYFPRDSVSVPHTQFGLAQT